MSKLLKIFKKLLNCTLNMFSCSGNPGLTIWMGNVINTVVSVVQDSFGVGSLFFSVSFCDSPAAGAGQVLTGESAGVRGK